jgi:hypothetical protein
LQALAKLEESLTRLEGNEKKAAALEQHLSTMQDCLRASRAELDELLTKFQELQLAWQCEVERAQGSIRDALDKASQHMARDLNQTLEKQGEAVSGQVAEGVRKRLEQEAAALLGDLTKQATARLSQLKQDGTGQIPFGAVSLGAGPSGGASGGRVSDPKLGNSAWSNCERGGCGGSKSPTDFHPSRESGRGAVGSQIEDRERRD